MELTYPFSHAPKSLSMCEVVVYNWMMRFVGMAVLLLSVALSGQENPHSGVDRASIDPNCKPCTDIWRYANGGWLNKNPIPARFSEWGRGLSQTEENQQRLQSILESAAANRSAPSGSNERKLGDFYASCMDTDTIEARGLEGLRPEFEHISAVDSAKDLVAIITEFQLNGFGDGFVGPFVMDKGQNLNDSKKVIATVYAFGLSLPDRDNYFAKDSQSAEIRDQFVKHAGKIFELSGDQPEAATARAKSVLAFETLLAEAAISRVEARNPEARYHPMKAAELNTLTPDYDWQPLLRQLHFSGDMTINVTEPGFMRRFNRQLTAVPLEHWRTWLRWRVLNLAAPYLAKRFVDQDFAFNSIVLKGIKDQKTRAQSCTDTVNDNMTDALGEAFVRKYFPPEAKRRMQELVESIRATLREELARADWLEPETRKKALMKIDAFNAKIGYPDVWRDSSDLSIDRRSFFQSLRAAWIHDRLYDLGKIGKPYDRNEWALPPQSNNAYANYQQNEIVFTAGILLPPIFDLEAGDVVNYATIGALVGHEMTHHFDDQGSKYDPEGNLKDWWTAEDHKKFAERTACVVDQFNRLDVGGEMHHNGKLVVGEAMADLGSITLAYKAYKHSLRGKSEPPVVDGFTIDQRFFLAFASKFSTQVRPEAVHLKLQTDTHPLPQYRAIGTLQNIPEFHRAFQCKPGDPMYRPPEAQCRLW
jgi:putative endopeptidase